MNKRFVRVIAATTVLATVGLFLELIPGGSLPAGAATGPVTVNVACAGATNDNAGTVAGATKTSADLIALLGTLGGPPTLSLPVSVTSNLPDRAKKGSGNLDANFQLTLQLPPSLASQAKTVLGKSSIDIVNAAFGITYDGAESGSLPTTTVPSTTIDLNSSAGTTITVDGPVPTDVSGHLNFRLAPFTLGIAVNGSVGTTASVGTLTVTCSTSSAVAGTSIQVPGAPDVPSVITAGPIIAGDTSLIPIEGRPDITPDDGNPIQWDTLSIVNGANGAQTAQGYLAQPTPASGGLIDTPMPVCAPSRPVPAVPGTDQVQTLMWPTPNISTSPGPHPTYMTLTFNGKETAPIPTSNDYSINPTNGLGLLGSFVAPSAAAIQSALQALPTVGAGNVKVTAVKGGYTIEFTGALGASPQPMVELGKWNTTPFPFSGYGQIQALITQFTSPASTTTTVPGATTTTDPTATTLNVDQLWAALLAGTITTTQFSQQLGSAVANSLISGATANIGSILATLKTIYPQEPDLSNVPTQGVLTIPATETGPLCSQFDVQTPAWPRPFIENLLKWIYALQHPQASVLGCTYTRVRERVRVKSHGRYVYVTKLVTVKKCAKPKK